MSLTPAVTDRAPSTDKKQGKKRDDAEFLRIARKRFDRILSAEAVNRQTAIDDLKFKKGDQWPEQIRAQRTIDRRPCLTINKCKTFVHQITNDQRQNRPGINVSPVGDKSDPNTARMLKGLIRQIERQSNADVAYDTGFDNAVSNGFGYWRVITDYEDDDTFDQVIRIQRIRNPFRVYIDPDHQEPDGSDAKYAFISDMVVRQEFDAEWPNADAIAWDQGGVGDEYKNWSTESHVRIAEYFCFEKKEKELVKLANGHVGFVDDLAPELKAKLDQEDFVKERRTVQVKACKWYKITAHEILEENDWAGKWIPIIKCIGDEIDIEGKVTVSGLIRDAKDPQRMYNYWCTAETELIALAPKAPYVMEEGQVEGHEQRWKNANEKSYPYLLYKGTSISGRQAPPPQRQPFAGPPMGVVQAKQGASQDMQATTGIRFDATLQERTYDESGKALRELKRTGDLGNFHYVDNLARSLRHTGRILIDLIPKIYDTPRILTILREDDSEEQVKIDPSLGVAHQTVPHPTKQGQTQKLFNPKLGDYEVAVTIGPSYASKRAEAADSMIAFSKAVPQAGGLIGDLIAKNMDWPGAEEIATRLASMLPPQLLQKGMDNFPPEAKALIGSLQTNLQKLGMEHQAAIKELNEKRTDQALDAQRVTNEKDKIDKDFEAKLTKIVVDAETKMMAQMGGHLKDITDTVKGIETQFSEFSKKKPKG